MRSHSEVVEEEGVLIKVLEQTEVALLNRQFALLFEVGVRVQNPAAVRLLRLCLHLRHSNWQACEAISADQVANQSLAINHDSDLFSRAFFLCFPAVVVLEVG